jgi:hypothetical protein
LTTFVKRCGQTAPLLQKTENTTRPHGPGRFGGLTKRERRPCRHRLTTAADTDS